MRAGPSAGWARWRGRIARGAFRGRRRSRRVLEAIRALRLGSEWGVIESVTSEEGELEVAGWAGGPHPILAVIVLVDGAPMAVAQLGERTINEFGQRGVRWQTRFSAPAGRRMGQARVAEGLAVTSTGLAERFGPVPVGVPFPAVVPTRWLDVPLPGSRVTSTVQVSGWTVADDLCGIEVAIDGVRTSAQPMSAVRPELAFYHPDLPHAALCGFDRTVSLPPGPAGRSVTVQVEEVLGGDRRELIGRVEVVTAAEESGACLNDEPRDADDARYLAALQARVGSGIEAPNRAPRDPAVGIAGNLSPSLRSETGDLRIVAITHDLGLGGGQLYLSELLLGLLGDYGVGCMVISPQDGPLRRELEDLGAMVHIAGPYVSTPILYESMLRELAELVTAFGPDALIVNTLGAFCGADLACRLGLPAVWAIHESYSFDTYWIAAYGPGGTHPYFEDRARFALGATSAVVFEADGTRMLWEPNGDPRRFVKIDYGIPTTKIDSYRKATDREHLRQLCGFDEDDIVLVCVGTIEPRKGQSMLVRAFARIIDRHPDARVVLVGDRGDAFGGAVRSYVRRLDLGDRLCVLDISDEIYSWYLMADAFVLASSVESLPRSVLEAMAFGLPVLTTDAFGLGELLTDGDTGIVVPAGSPVALESALDRLLFMSRREREELGGRGESLVRVRHDSSGYVGAFRTLLHGLADDPTAFPDALLGRA